MNKSKLEQASKMLKDATKLHSGLSAILNEHKNKHKALIESEFPDLFGDVESMVKNNDFKGLKEKMEAIKKASDDKMKEEMEAKMDEKIKNNTK